MSFRSFQTLRNRRVSECFGYQSGITKWTIFWIVHLFCKMSPEEINFQATAGSAPPDPTKFMARTVHCSSRPSPLCSAIAGHFFVQHMLYKLVVCFSVDFHRHSAGESRVMLLHASFAIFYFVVASDFSAYIRSKSMQRCQMAYCRYPADLFGYSTVEGGVLYSSFQSLWIVNIFDWVT